MQIDLTKFPEGPQEIAKYMDYMPEDENSRVQLIMAFMTQLISR